MVSEFILFPKSFTYVKSHFSQNCQELVDLDIGNGKVNGISITENFKFQAINISKNVLLCQILMTCICQVCNYVLLLLYPCSRTCVLLCLGLMVLEKLGVCDLGILSLCGSLDVPCWNDKNI